MNKSVSGKSALTSSGTLLFYYACGLLTFVLGFPVLIAAVGALLSRSAAKKEGVLLVRQHCTWIFRSIYMSLALLITVTFYTLVILGVAFPTFPEVSHIQTFSEIWENPDLRRAVQYSAAFVLAITGVLVWFLYRMLRGGYTLLLLRAPKKA